MSLEAILKKIKKAAVTVSLPVALLSSGPIMAQPSGSRVTNDYRINAEELSAGPVTLTDINNFATAGYSVTENNGRYDISGNMLGRHNLYHSRMRFHVYGEVRNNRYFPQHYEMQFTHDSALNHEGTIKTIIDFDYVNHKAFPYSRHETRNRMLYDFRPNGVVIDDNVKDIISGIMDFRNSSLNSSTSIRTLINGNVTDYPVAFEGSEQINYQGSQIPCVKYSLRIPKNVIDSNSYRFMFWITQSRSRTPMKIRIQPGRSILWALHLSTRRD